ncbi:MAG: glycosyltransferase [Chloroflexi bacterium]|nr:glycosyltransferase [Chloroflexota bacterium]
MRILHVIPWLAPRYGGPAALVPDLCIALARRGHEVEIVTTNTDGDARLPVPVGRPVPWAGAMVTFHALSAPTQYLTSWSMLADLRRRIEGFDVVHIHALYRFHDVVAAAVARHRSVPYVVQPHGSLDPWHRARRRHAKDVYHALIEDRVIRGAAVVLCTSEREAKAIRDLGYKVPARIIPVGIDVDDLRAPAHAGALPCARIDRGTRVVTFLGRIAPKKGLPLLIDAFAQTAATFPTAHLVIAGPDDEGIGRQLGALIAHSGLGDRISFVGTISGAAKRALLQRSDVFVLPSADESFGVAVAEAMAVGCPVVVSPHVAIEDIVRSSGAGMVVERNPAAIAKAVATILADPAAASVMGEAGRKTVDERFAWPMIAARMETMYAGIVDASRARVQP